MFVISFNTIIKLLLQIYPSLAKGHSSTAQRFEAIFK